MFREKPTTFKLEWAKAQYDVIRTIYSKEDISDETLYKYIISEYEKRYIHSGYIYNNVKNEYQKLTQEEFINYYLNSDAILSGYATLFNNQNKKHILSFDLLTSLLGTRKKYKKQMLVAEPGTTERIFYMILQLTYKVLSNSFYGATGEPNSVFYNSFVQNSITLTGVDVITASIMAIESFLSNNVKFRKTDDVLKFIKNVEKEDYKYSILEYVNPISKETLQEYLINQCMSPNRTLIQNAVNKLNEKERTKIYYKNNFMTLIEQDYFKNEFKTIVGKTCIENQVDEEVGMFLSNVKPKIVEFCFYDHIVEDRFLRAHQEERKSVIIVDTDSNFLNIDKCLQYMVDNFGINGRDKLQRISSLNIFIDIITETLNKTFQTLTTHMGVLEEFRGYVKMKNELVYDKILLADVKKAYAGNIIAQEGKIFDKPALDIKGLQIKKTVINKKIREVFHEFLENDILNAEKISLKNILQRFSQIENDIRKSLENGEVLFSIPKSIEVLSTYKDMYSQDKVRGMLAWNMLEPSNTINPPDKINMFKLTTADFESDGMKFLKENHPEKYEIIKNGIFDGGNHKFFRVHYTYNKNELDVETEFAFIETQYEITEKEFLEESKGEYITIENNKTTIPSQQETECVKYFKVKKSKDEISKLARFGFSLVCVPKNVEKLPDYLIPLLDYNAIINDNVKPGMVLLNSLGVVCTTKSSSSIRKRTNIIEI